jgi:hypothetical protein
MEVPESPSVTLVGDRLQVKPVAGDTVDVRATVPPKPRSALTLMVDDPEAPARTLMLVGLAETVKSWTVKPTVCEWDSVPSVPLTVTV